jgi:hypothetical protein
MSMLLPPSRKAILILAVLGAGTLAQPSPVSTQDRPGFTPSPAKPQAPVERLGPDRLRVGNVLIDTDRREVSVGGVVNDVSVLEYLANTKEGAKAYESALELDTNAINFNVALILVGMDPSRSVLPKMKFDPDPPKGDPLEIWVEWEDGGSRRRVRAEEVVYNREAKRTITEGAWVYTGSQFSEAYNTFQAEIAGTIVGFMHTPDSLIDNAQPIIGSYGSSIINPALNLKPGTPVLLTVRALPRGR